MNTPQQRRTALGLSNRKAYIARYTLSQSGNDLDETILAQDSYCSPQLFAEWDRLIETRAPSDPMLQLWYSDDCSVSLQATTNQPFRLSP